MSVLALVVFLTLLVSALCSLFEATLYSTRLGTLEAARADPHRGKLARRFIVMKRQIDVPIAAILILNTVANTAGATLAGMFASKLLGTSRVVVFSIALTLSILVLSEIIPKTLGAVYWRRLWPLIVWPLTGMKYGLYPVIAITRKLTTVLTHGHHPAPITEEEIIAMARLGAQTGEISPQESRMVHNIISLENRQVCDIMTPRTVIFSLDATTNVEAALPIVSDKGWTRIPVYEGDREHIIGYVTFQELSTAYLKGQSQTQLGSMLKDISFLPETDNCLTVLTSFLRTRRHIAIVSDTYGGVAGLVTLEDLIETILGTEIVDETDRVVDLQKSARRRQRRRRTR